MNDYRERLTRFYKEYNPSMIGEVNSLLKKYKGIEDELFQTLYSKYGKPGQKYRQEVIRLYKLYNPSKLEQVDGLLKKYEGNENALLQSLVDKYEKQAEKTQLIPSDETVQPQPEIEDATQEPRSAYWKKIDERRRKEKTITVREVANISEGVKSEKSRFSKKTIAITAILALIMSIGFLFLYPDTRNPLLKMAGLSETPETGKIEKPEERINTKTSNDVTDKSEKNKVLSSIDRDNDDKVNNAESKENRRMINTNPHIQEEKQSSSHNIHVVEKGRTLYSLSKMYNVSVDDIKRWNNLRSNNLEVGMRLKINGDSPEIDNSSSACRVCGSYLGGKKGEEHFEIMDNKMIFHYWRKTEPPANFGVWKIVDNKIRWYFMKPEILFKGYEQEYEYAEDNAEAFKDLLIEIIVQGNKINTIYEQNQYEELPFDTETNRLFFGTKIFIKEGT